MLRVQFLGNRFRHSKYKLLGIFIALTVCLYVKYDSTRVKAVKRESVPKPSQEKVQVAETEKFVTIVAYNPNNDFPFHRMSDYLLESCPYKHNCLFTKNRTNLRDQNAILYAITSGPPLPLKPPISPQLRRKDQIWILNFWEPPTYHYLGTRPVYMNQHWINTTNWTMSYMYDSDIFFPFGTIRKRTEVPNRNYSDIFHKKTRLAAWVVSNCDTFSKREVYVEQLWTYGVKVDVYGECNGKRVNNALFHRNISKDYIFYLAFENSICKDYITEKFFGRLELDVVLVTRGGANYSRLLPDDAYINAANFKNAKELATFMLHVASNETLFTRYMKNKSKYEYSYNPIWNEAACKICEKLHKLDENRDEHPNVIEKIHKNTCFPPTDLDLS